MSLNGLYNTQYPLTLDGTQSIDATSITINGQSIDLTALVPYTGATQPLDMGSQAIRTTNTATLPQDVVNKALLDYDLANISVLVGNNFLQKTTAFPQTVQGAVSFQSGITTSDNTTTSLASRVEVGTNYQTVLDAGTVVVSQYLGSITHTGGIYQATTQTGGDSVLSLFSISAGQRASYTISFRIYDPANAWFVELYQSSDNISPFNGIIAIVENFPSGDNTFHILGEAFTASTTGYICARISSSNPSATVAVDWMDMATFGMGVSLTNTTYPSLTADRVAVLNDRKQLVSSGISTTKLDYLSGVSSDIQTQLNDKASFSYVDTQDALRVPYTGATQGLDMGANKVTTTYVPINGSDLINKTYGDTTYLTSASITGLVPYTGATQGLNMGANRIQTTFSPVLGSDVINRAYGDTTYLTSASITGLVPYTGATQGLNMGANRIQTTFSPVLGSDVINRTFADNTYASQSSLASYLPLVGGTMTGNISMGSNFVLCNTNPSSNDQLTRKAYVDTLIIGRVPRTGDTGLIGDYATSGSITGAGLISTGGVRGSFFITASGVIQYNEVSDKGKWFKIMSIDSRAYVEGHITYSVAGQHGHVHFIVSHEFNSNPSIRVVASSFYGTPVVEQLRFSTDNASIYNTAYVEMYLGNFDWYEDNINIYVYAINSAPTNSTYSVYTTTKQAGTTSGFTYQTVVCNVMTDIMMNGTRFYIDSNANMGITGETRTANVFVGSGSYLNCGNGADSGSESSRTQIAFGWQGSSRQYRHRITSEHNGGDGTGGNGNSLNFYLWSNANGVDDFGTNHRMTIAGGGVGINTLNPSAPLHITASGESNPSTNGIYVYNTSNSAGQDAIITARTGGSSAGDAYTSYDIADEYGWATGLHNGDNSYRINMAWSSLTSNVHTFFYNKGVVDIKGGSGGGSWGKDRVKRGSLVIGREDENYGGETGETGNTCCLLMDCLDNTEIAIHDSGNRMSSVMRYIGDVNTIFMGRDMGWGTTKVATADDFYVAGTTYLQGEVRAQGFRTEIQSTIFTVLGSNVYLGTTSLVGEGCAYFSQGWDRMLVYANGYSTAGGYAYYNEANNLGTISDRRIKRDFQPVPEEQSIAFLKALEPTSFCLKEQTTKHTVKRVGEDGKTIEEEVCDSVCSCRQDGWVAQNVLEACVKSGASKSVVNHWADYEKELLLPEEERKTLIGVSDRPILSHTVNVVKALMARVETLEKREVMWESHARQQEETIKGLKERQAKMEAQMEKVGRLLAQMMPK